jgi:anti-anti-sigma factor
VLSWNSFFIINCVRAWKLVTSSASQRRLALSGDWDLGRREELRDLLVEVDGTKPIVIDVREVTYADSSFLHELSLLRKRLTDCSITLLGPKPALKRVLEILSFDKLFQIVEAE